MATMLSVMSEQGDVRSTDTTEKEEISRKTEENEGASAHMSGRDQSHSCETGASSSRRAFWQTTTWSPQDSSSSSSSSSASSGALSLSLKRKAATAKGRQTTKNAPTCSPRLSLSPRVTLLKNNRRSSDIFLIGSYRYSKGRLSRPFPILSSSFDVGPRGHTCRCGRSGADL